MSDAFEKWWEDPEQASLVHDVTTAARAAWEAGRIEGLREAWLLARDTCHAVADEYPEPESHLIFHVNDRVLEAIREKHGGHPGAAPSLKREEDGG